MLIVCPSCASNYTIEAERLGAAGRRVRCAACRETWFVAPEAAAVAAPADVPHLMEVPEAAPAITAFAQSHHSGRVPRPAVRPRGGRRPFPVRLAGSIVGPLRRAPGFAAMGGLMLLLTAAVLARDALVGRWPAAAHWYAAAGWTAKPLGLAFAAVRSEIAIESGSAILIVEGEIRNNTGAAVDVPALVFGVRGAAGQALYSWTADPSRPTIEPDGTLPFRSRLASPPPEGHDVLVRFANHTRLAQGGETR